VRSLYEVQKKGLCYLSPHPVVVLAADNNNECHI
jgi:hypothetical protein